MNVYYDARDVKHAAKLGDRRFEWLDELGARPIQDADLDVEGFLFGYQNGIEDLQKLLADRPHIRDRAEEREDLIYLDRILSRLDKANVKIPGPRSWVLQIDDPPPPDLTFPLFVRTASSSWKRGGQVSRVRNLKELDDEVGLLRKAFQWDATIVVREWLDLAAAGEWRYGTAPQEIRTWIVDHVPLAWSFHYLHVVPRPKGFPPSPDELKALAGYANEIGRAFDSRLIAADFVRSKNGTWSFLEAGPGACCGTAHEDVFKAVARRLAGESVELDGDDVGGSL
jgi:hypothetical protein